MYMSAQPMEMPECEREKIVRVSVNEDGYPRVEPDFIEIDRRLDEKVVWRADEGVNFTICFGDETPFESFHFHPSMSSSGSVRKGATGGEYKYCVEVNGKVIDPKVGVRPPG
jgi:hypothetical protein